MAAGGTTKRRDARQRAKTALTRPTDQLELDQFLKGVLNDPIYRRVQARQDVLRAEAQAIEGTDEDCLERWSQIITRSEDGWDVPRENLHTKIANEFLLGHKRCFPGDRRVVIVVGPPGSGKSSIGVKNVHNTFGEDFVTVDSDAVKAMLPEYQGWNSTALHEESKGIVNRRIIDRAIQKNLSLILDIVGHNSTALAGRIEHFRKTHAVFLLLVHLPHWESAWRVWERFLRNPFRLADAEKDWGRYVPPEYAGSLSGVQSPEHSFNAVKDNPAVCGYCRIDVNPHNQKSFKITETHNWSA
jgi:hypothetical protein